jgi:hypothetical protein
MNSRRILWDIDETLLHTSLSKPEDRETKSFFMEGDEYFTAMRPSALKSLQYTRDLVGEGSVVAVTTATFEYAKYVNSLFGFGFPETHIVAREHLNSRDSRNFDFDTNVLIDNLYPRDNYQKMGLMKVKLANYCHIPGFFGYPDNDIGENNLYYCVVRFFTEHQKAENEYL